MLYGDCISVVDLLVLICLVIKLRVLYCLFCVWVILVVSYVFYVLLFRVGLLPVAYWIAVLITFWLFGVLFCCILFTSSGCWVVDLFGCVCLCWLVLMWIFDLFVAYGWVLTTWVLVCFYCFCLF